MLEDLLSPTPEDIEELMTAISESPSLVNDFGSEIFLDLMNDSVNGFFKSVNRYDIIAKVDKLITERKNNTQWKIYLKSFRRAFCYEMFYFDYWDLTDEAVDNLNSINNADNEKIKKFKNDMYYFYSNMIRMWDYFYEGGQFYFLKYGINFDEIDWCDYDDKIDESLADEKGILWDKTWNLIKGKEDYRSEE